MKKKFFYCLIICIIFFAFIDILYVYSNSLKINEENEKNNVTQNTNNSNLTIDKELGTNEKNINELEEIIELDKEEYLINKEQNKEKKTNIKTTSNGEEYSVIAELDIPTLGINYPILSSTSVELLKIGLNKYWGAEPNQVGNMVVVGHNYKNGTYFSDLNKIKNGEIIKITDLTGKTLEYSVYDTYIIDPYDNRCTSQLTNGNTEITLITCYNNGQDRFVVKARVER